MALNGNTMGTAVKDAILGVSGVTLEEPDKAEEVWQAICGAIVAHIQANAVVSTTVAAGIAVAVTPATGIGSTTATGAGTGTVA